MAGSNSQQRGKEQSGDQERSSHNSHPGRNTSNSRRASEESKGLQGSASNQKPILKTSRQQTTPSESLAVPRCTSPIPIKDTTPQLNLDIPGPQTRSRYQRRNPQALIGSVKIMKRHTSPYPTPASSPNGEGLLDGLSPAPRRSGTCPGPTLDLTGKYKEKMDVFLQSIHPQLGGDVADKEPAPKNKMEANPVPDFFVNPTHTEVATVKFGDSWMAGMSESPERDLMDNEFIGTLGSVQDLDEDMRDWLPDTTFSEFMPGPEDPIPEVATPILMLQNMDLDSVASPIEVHGAHSHSLQEETFNRMESTQFLNTPQSVNTLPSDSGIESPAAIKRQLFTTVTGEDVQEKNAFVTSSTVVALGLTGGGLGSNQQLNSSQMSFNGNLFGDVGELTPPSSAHRSPSPSSALFIGKESTKKLAPESIEIIETAILDSMTTNPDLQEFSGLCESVRGKMQAGKFGSLRDVEKDLWFGCWMVASSTRSAQVFCFESMILIRHAAARIHECDLYKREDLVYGEGYFTDKFAEIEQFCIDSKMATVKSEDSHKKRNRMQAEIVLQSQKRKNLSLIAKMSTITRRATGSSSPLASARVLDEQHKRAFIKPAVQSQQRQHLEIQTLVQPLLCPPQENSPAAGSSFTVDQRTNNAVAQAQYHNAKVYRNGISEVLGSSAPFSVQEAYSLPPTPVSAGSAMPISFVLPPVGISASVENATNSTATRRRGPVPVFTPSTNDEPSALICTQCEKRFPRRCDLTKHEKTHDRPFKCDIPSCKYHLEGFPTNKECERHQNDIHASNSKEWRCEFPPCQYKSKRESNCKQHMEKAHPYTYTRMKRNPRRRDHGVPAPAPARRRRNVRAALAALSSAPATQQPSSTVIFPRPQPPQSGTGAQQEHNPFAHSFGYVQQPRVSSLDNIILSDDTFPGTMDDHPMGMDQPFYVGDYNTELHCNPDTSPTLVSENLLPTQSTEYMKFLSDYPDSENSFGVAPQVYQRYPFDSGFDFSESSDCERQGDTPD